VTDADIIDLLQLVLNSPFANSLTRQFTLTALAKLYVRFAEAQSSSASTQQERVNEILASYGTSPDLELQQRAIEYTSLFARNDLVGGVLEHMPAPEIKATIMGTGKQRSACFRRRLRSSTSCSYCSIGEEASRLHQGR
jgi:AP-1 complex subunit gamma-1